MKLLRELCSSDNGLFVLGIKGFTDDKQNFADFSVYRAVDLQKYCDFTAPFTIGGKRAAVSDHGYAVTAAYSHKGISLIDCNLGKELWNTKAVKKVQRVVFSKDGQYIIASSEEEPAHTYYLEFLTGNIKKRIVASAVFSNPYGEDIVFWHRDNILIRDKKIKSPTFSYLTACGTPFGIAVSPVNSFPKMYDYDGNPMWRTITNMNHILKFGYNEEKQILYGISSDGIVALNPQNGEMMKAYNCRLGYDALFINHVSQVLYRYRDGNGIIDLKENS